MGRTHRCLIGVYTIVAACSSDTAPVLAPPPVDHDVQGSWGEDFGAISPGNSFLVALTESSGTVSGTGSFSGEAAPFGSLAVNGIVAKDSLHLRIIFNFDSTLFRNLQPDTEHFEGVLARRDTIAGQLTRGGSTSPLRLVRLKISDPP
jgi:hypothetical protein